MIRLAIIAVILTILSGAAYSLVQYVRTLEAAEWQDKVRKATDAARADEKKTQGAINDSLQRQHNEISTINDNLLADIERMQSRPTSSDLPRDPEANCEAAVGSELAREHAGFLVRYAAEAAKQDAALVACYSYADSLDELRPITK